MEWFSKLIAWIKLPFLLIVFVVWLLSTGMLFLSDDILEKVYLLSYKSGYGQYFGIAFALSSALIIAYLLFYLWTAINTIVQKLMYNYRLGQKIKSLSNAELGIVFELFCKPDNMGIYDMNSPIIQRLLARNIIYGGARQLVSYDVYTETLPAKYVLQSNVVRFVDKELKKEKRELEKNRKKLSNPKLNAEMKKHLQQKVRKTQEMLQELENWE